MGTWTQEMLRGPHDQPPPEGGKGFLCIDTYADLCTYTCLFLYEMRLFEYLSIIIYRPPKIKDDAKEVSGKGIYEDMYVYKCVYLYV